MIKKSLNPAGREWERNCIMEFIDLKTLQQQTSLSIYTLRRYMQQFGMPCYRVGRKILVNPDEFEKWLVDEQKRLEAKEMEGLTRPCKMKIMPNYVFRQSNPAIVGMDIIVGSIKVGDLVMKDGKDISSVKSIQHEKDTLSKIEAGKQVAISLPGVTVGRQINEGDTLYSGIPEPDFRKLKEFKKYLSKEELEVMKEIATLKRQSNPLWGV